MYCSESFSAMLARFNHCTENTHSPQSQVNSFTWRFRQMIRLFLLQHSNLTSWIMCMRRLCDIMNGLDCRDAIAEPYMDVFTGVLNNDEYLWNTNIIHDDNYSYSNTKHAHICLLRTPWILPCRLGVGVLPPTLLQPIYFAYSMFEWSFSVDFEGY